jgi:hypothetical protein
MSESDNTVETTIKIKPQNEKNSKPDVTLYENILHEIRHMNVLSSYQIHYLRSISKEQLIEVVELYNIVMRNVNDIL